MENIWSRLSELRNATYSPERGGFKGGSELPTCRRRLCTGAGYGRTAGHACHRSYIGVSTHVCAGLWSSWTGK